MGKVEQQKTRQTESRNSVGSIQASELQSSELEAEKITLPPQPSSSADKRRADQIRILKHLRGHEASRPGSDLQLPNYVQGAPSNSQKTLQADKIQLRFPLESKYSGGSDAKPFEETNAAPSEPLYNISQQIGRLKSEIARFARSLRSWRASSTTAPASKERQSDSLQEKDPR